MESGTPNGARARRLRKPKLLIAVALSALVVAVPAAWASHDFADVPTSSPFHAAISAIKGAGITTGCGGGNYCPGDNVSREAMAAFLHRGFGRVAHSSPAQLSNNSATATTFSQTITPGLPAGALAGAAGFIKADAQVTLELTDSTGCPCTWALWFKLDGSFITAWYSRVTLVGAQPHMTVPVLATGRVTTAGPHTVELGIFRQSGSGTVVVRPTISSTYYPFGSTGTNTLGGVDATAAAPADAAP